MITILVVQTNSHTHSYWDALDKGPSSAPGITEVEILVEDILLFFEIQ
jgi:hypothetical protein